MLLALIAVGVGLFVGVARRGRLRNVTRARVRMAYMLLPGLCLPLLYEVFSEPMPLAASIGSLAALLVFVAANLHLVGIVVVGIGIAMNLVPLATNMAMPVRPGALVEADLIDPGQDFELRGAREVQDDDTFAPWLGDTIPLPETRQVLSFGDLVILVGLGDLTTNLLVSRHGRRKRLPRGADSLVRALELQPMPLESAMVIDLTGHPLPQRRPAPIRAAEPEPVPAEIDLTNPEPEPAPAQIRYSVVDAPLGDDWADPGSSVFVDARDDPTESTSARETTAYVPGPSASVFDLPSDEEELEAGPDGYDELDLTYRVDAELESIAHHLDEVDHDLGATTEVPDTPEVTATEVPDTPEVTADIEVPDTPEVTADIDADMPARSVLDQLLARLDDGDDLFGPDNEHHEPALDLTDDHLEDELFAPDEHARRSIDQLSLDDLFADDRVSN